MANTFYFLRHGKTQVDKDEPISTWILSKEGEEQAEELLKVDELKGFDVICASTEEKAFQTAKPLAMRDGKEILRVDELRELDRDRGGHMDLAAYEEAVRKTFTNQTEKAGEWESAAHALERFSGAIDSIDRQYRDKKILIVGHGYTINLYFAKLLGRLDVVYERLHTNDFCSWGIVREGKVIYDLARNGERFGERLV